MRQYQVTLTGKSPLLMHWDNLTAASELRRWREDPKNAKLSVKGDDRSPAFTWLGYLYNDGTRIVMPADNLMRCCMEGGASVPVPGGKGGKTFKSQSQSGMMPHEESWPLLIAGEEIPMQQLLALKNESDFDVHERVAKEHRFSLFLKRAKIGASKHVRVRPMFTRWSLTGIVDVWDDQITQDVLTNILSVAGAYKGLGDWRPSSKTPGPHGRFAAAVKKV